MRRLAALNKRRDAASAARRPVFGGLLAIVIHRPRPVNNLREADPYPPSRHRHAAPEAPVTSAVSG